MSHLIWWIEWLKHQNWGFQSIQTQGFQDFSTLFFDGRIDIHQLLAILSSTRRITFVEVAHHRPSDRLTIMSREAIKITHIFHMYIIQVNCNMWVRYMYICISFRWIVICEICEDHLFLLCCYKIRSIHCFRLLLLQKQLQEVQQEQLREREEPKHERFLLKWSLPNTQSHTGLYYQNQWYGSVIWRFPKS